MKKLLRLFRKRPKCVCRGNFRLIINESEKLMGRYFNCKGERCFFEGVAWAYDDFYYIMWHMKSKKYVLSSCVGSLETNGYKLLPDEWKEASVFGLTNVVDHST